MWGEFRVTGSHKVFRKFFMSWYSDLCRYALYWLPDMQDAEEVVLDFFMHLWLHRSTVNISSSFKGYALMSVRNRCISRLRCSRVTVSIDELDPLSCLYEQDGMSVEDASRIVWEAVSTLPAKSREIRRARERLQEAARSTLELATLQYINGIISYLDVLDAQRAYFDAQVGLNHAVRDELLATVQLYKVLGGGVEVDDSAEE